MKDHKQRLVVIKKEPKQTNLDPPEKNIWFIYNI